MPPIIGEHYDKCYIYIIYSSSQNSYESIFLFFFFYWFGKYDKLHNVTWKEELTLKQGLHNSGAPGFEQYATYMLSSYMSFLFKLLCLWVCWGFLE